jgi:hypothetical protein
VCSIIDEERPNGTNLTTRTRQAGRPGFTDCTFRSTVSITYMYSVLRTLTVSNRQEKEGTTSKPGKLLVDTRHGNPASESVGRGIPVNGLLLVTPFVPCPVGRCTTTYCHYISTVPSHSHTKIDCKVEKSFGVTCNVR